MPSEARGLHASTPTLQVFPTASPVPEGPDSLDQLSAIIRAQEEIAGAGLDLGVVLDVVIRQARDLTGGDGAAVALVRGDDLVLLATVGDHGPVAPWDLSRRDPFAGLCLMTGRAVRCDDTEVDPRVDPAINRHRGVRSLVVVPLHHDGRALGVLAVNSLVPDRFGEPDVRGLTRIAGLVGSAIGHAEAYQVTQALLAEQTAALEDLREGEDRFRAFMDNGPAVAFLKDEQGRYLFANAPLCRLVPTEHADLRGKTDADWLPENSARIAAQSDQMAREAGRLIEVNESIVLPDGRESHWLVFKFPVRDRHGQLLVGGVGVDISDRKALERRLADQLRVARELNAELERRRREAEQTNTLLAELVTTDGLTGLKNVRHFREILDRLCSTTCPEPFSLILLDVDHFKAYNDAHGHLAGDEVLRALGEILRASLRPGDLAARYGGEEFVILLPQTSSAGASVVAERLRLAITSQRWPRRPITASFGVTTSTRIPIPPTDLIDQADRALYRSKQAGRDRVTHHDRVGENSTPRSRPIPDA